MEGQTESDEGDPEAAMPVSRLQVEAKSVQVRPDLLCSKRKTGGNKHLLR